MHTALAQGMAELFKLGFIQIRRDFDKDRDMPLVFQSQCLPGGLQHAQQLLKGLVGLQLTQVLGVGT